MIIEIDGVGRVEVDDSFANLSPEQQRAAVEMIREQSAAGNPSGEVPTQRLRAVAQGVTLGFAEEAEAAIRNPLSIIEAAEAPFTAMGEQFGVSFRPISSMARFLGVPGDYSGTLEDIRGKLSAYREDRPIEALAYEIGGAALPTLAAGLLTAPAGGAGAAGTATATSARLAPTLARAAALGGGEGAVAGFGAGEGGLANRLGSAAVGGTIGAVAAPVAAVGAERLARGGRSILDTLGVGGAARAQTIAERKMLEAMARDGVDPATALARLQEAQALGITDITPADLGEAARRQGWRAQAIPSERNQPVQEFFDERRLAQAQQIAEGATSMSGRPTSTGIDFIDQLDAQTQAMARPAYNAAYSVILPTDPFRRFANRQVIIDAYKRAQDLADIEGAGNMPPLDQLLSGDRLPTAVAHQIKRGLDALVEAETDAVTGKVTQRGRSLVQLTREWNDTIKGLNPEYANANAMYADRQRLMDAYRLGVDFSKTGEKELVRAVGRMTPAEREALRVGVISKVQELASSTRDASNFVDTVFGSPQRRMALRLSFADPDEFARFERFIQFQREKVRTGRKVTGGSETAERTATMQEGQVDPSVIMNLGMGNIGGAAQAAGRQALSRVQGMNERSAAAMSQMLFETDPVRQAQIMRRLASRGELDAAMAAGLFRRPEIYAGQLGATAGLLSGSSAGNELER